MEVVVYNMEILKHFGLKKSEKKNWQNLQRLTDWFNISQYIYIYIYIYKHVYILYTLYIIYIYIYIYIIHKRNRHIFAWEE